MDANGLRFWSLAEEVDWNLPSTGELRYDRERRTLKLSSFRALAFVEPEEDPEDLVSVVPQAVDAFDTYAYLDSEQVFAAGAVPGNESIASFLFRPVSDLLLGFDGILYLVVSGGLSLLDPRRRWPETPVPEPDLVAFRLAAQLAGGVLILDRQNKRIWLSEGQPFPSIGFRQFDGDVFRPDEENPNPPRVRPLIALANDEDPVAFATSSRGDTVLLSWLSGVSGRSACIRRVELDGRLGSRVLLVGVQRPFSIGWLDGNTVAVLVRTVVPGSGGTTTRVEVVPYTFPGPGDTANAQPLGGVFPLVNYSNGPFAHVVREPVRYPAQAAASIFPDLPRHLVRLSAPELAREGTGTNAKRLDSGRVGTTWHRCYLEAVLPSQCAVQVLLAASETAVTPPNDAFFPHLFGDLAAPAGVPRGVWSSQPSELPFNLGLAPCPPEAHRAGLFSVLVQRAGRLVTKLVGRYLHVRVELIGNARATPEIAAVRVYGSRFSYVEQYLPRLYQEQIFPPDADAQAPATAADFLERFLGTFESFLTPLEDRIANAHLLTDPESAPEAALDWLGQWVGFVFDPAYPPEQRRRALQSATELHRWHGTLRGLNLALNILTDDGLERGEIVVVEDYRLRRTFATILGADLADENDPLTAGIVDSGNSIVGDTLILGSEMQREFLSVFRDQLPERPPGVSLEQWASFLLQRSNDRAVIDAFFDKFANRLTVLVQREVNDDKVRLIQRILELEAPAHVLSQVVRATQPFIVGLASLVGVDTFLRGPEPLPATRIDQSRIGTSFLLRPASLDPRLEVGT